jgi:hypothetical protein
MTKLGAPDGAAAGDLNVDTWRWVRIRAAEQHTTMSGVVEEALQQARATSE